MSIIAGVGPNSGINYEELISKLLDIERQPITRLQNKQDAYNNKISTYNTLSSKLSSLKSAADNLRTTSKFYSKTVSVSDSTIVEATASSSAIVGNYTISTYSATGTISLASEEKEVHSGVASSTTVVNNSGSSKVFQYTYAGTQRTLTVSDGSTLSDLKDLINNDSSNPGVTASILYDGSVYRLVITGNDTGSSNTITIDSGTTLDGTGGTVDFRSSTFTETKTAADAKFSVDGVDIVRSSNTVSDVITGVTFTLKKSTTSSATVSVSNDTSAISQKIQDFVSAYNDVINYINENSTYDIKTHTGGPLYAEGTARNIFDHLQSTIIKSVSSLSSDLHTLSQIGVSTNRDGTLSLDTSTLSSKLSSSLSKVATLFTDSSEGIATLVYSYTDDLTKAVTGTIDLKVYGLTKTVNSLSEDITQLEEKITLKERDLRQQFASLETLLGSLSTQGQFLGRLVSSWG